MATKEIDLLRKYCGALPEGFDLYSKGQPLHLLLIRQLTSLEYAESELRRVARQVTDTANKVLANLDAGPEDRVYQLNSLGELQSSGPNLDRLIALRQEHITMIQCLMGLIRQAVAS